MLGYKAISKLDRKKYRQLYNSFLVEGKKSVLEAVQSDQKVIQLLVTASFKKEHPDYMKIGAIKAFEKSQKITELNDKSFFELTETVTPQGIAAVVALPEYDLATLLKSSQLALLDDVRDPGNLGTIIRTADWFGLGGIIAIGGADPFQPKVVRASMGSIFRVPILAVDSIGDVITALHSAHFNFVVSRPEISDELLEKQLGIRGQSIASLNLALNQSQNQEGRKIQEKTQFTTLYEIREKIALKNSETSNDVVSSEKPNKQATKLCVAFGNEARGTSLQVDRAADYTVSIPQFGTAESLNVAVSFGILASQMR